MPIALTTDQLCPSQLAQNTVEIFKRSFSSDVTTTAESFKSWNTCMANKTCKIVAIVGIVVAAIVLFGVIGILIRCFCCGVKGLGEIFCCCCSCCRSSADHHHHEKAPQRSAYENPFMYPEEHHNPNYQPNINYAPVSQPQFQYGPGVVSDEVNYGHKNAYNGNNDSNHYGYGHAGGNTYRS